MQKNCIQSILPKLIQNSALACFIMDQVVNGTEIHKFKTKDSEIIAAPICLGNISRDISVDNMKNTGLNRYVNDFSVDYDAITNDKILNIHKYLMAKYNII